MNAHRFVCSGAAVFGVGCCLLMMLALLGCPKGGEDQDGPAEGPPTKDTPAPTAKKGGTPAAGQSSSWVVKTAAGSEAVRIAVQGANVTVDFGGQKLVGEAKSGSRRYSLAGKAIGKIKSDGAKFKLKDPSGTLLWKVKIKTDKIKIADNDELENAYSIKDKGGGKYKVKRGETELGKVTFKSDGGKVKVKDAQGAEQFVAKTDKSSAMYGLLLLSDIPEPQRYILMAELAARGH